MQYNRIHFFARFVGVAVLGALAACGGRKPGDDSARTSAFKDPNLIKIIPRKPTVPGPMPGLDGELVAKIPTPQGAWRVNAVAVEATVQANLLRPLLSGGAASWQPVVTGAAEPAPSFAFKVARPDSGGAVMLTYGGLYSNAGRVVTFERATETSPGVAPTSGWTVVSRSNPTHFLEKFDFTPTGSDWYRMSVAPAPGEALPATLFVTELGLYDLGGTQPKDYWLMLGASLEVQAFRNSQFKADVKTAFPGHDPVMFNLGVGGWTSQELVNNLPDILAAHPQATYVGIHIGGNDVNNERPFPGGASQLSANLQTILKMITHAGKVPILARLTYRAYQGQVPVPPEDNGSGPYVNELYDPLIYMYCPAFFDWDATVGYVNGYSFFQAHPELLMGVDGIHLTPAGATSWQRYWVQRAGPVVYKQAPAN